MKRSGAAGAAKRRFSTNFLYNFFPVEVRGKRLFIGTIGTRSHGKGHQ